MGRFIAIVRIVFRRAMGHRRLLSLVVVGMVLASALMSSVVLYSDAIRDLGLKYALRTAPAYSNDLRIVSSSQPLRPAEFAKREETTKVLLDTAVGSVDDERVRYIRSSTFFLTPPGAQVPTADDRPRAHFQYQDGLEKHVTVLEGALPKPVTAYNGGPAPALEVLIGRATAEKLGVKVGDRFDLHAFWRPEAEPVHITVSGIIEATDPEERFWFGRDRMSEDTPSWPTYPFFTTEQKTLTDVLAAYLPDIDAGIETYVFIDTGAIDSRNARRIEDGVNGLQGGLARDLERTSLETGLGERLKSYREKLFFTRLPLFALMLQVVGIVLYYLVMVSTMVVERQTGEIALLKSRGASVAQVMGIYVIEGLMLTALAVVLGPLVALGAISVLGYTPPFAELSENSLLEVRLSALGVLFALFGALLGLAAMLWPAWKASQLSVVHYKTHLARPQSQPLFIKYYLDLGLIVVAAFAFWQLRQRGSLVTDRLFGDLSADPLLLATPTLFMLMIALLFLRLFPIALRLVAWAAAGLNGATIPLGMNRMTRSPLQYSRLILLLILATAVGMFAAGFGATLDRSYDDRAGYQGGADARIQGVRVPGGLSNDAFEAKIRQDTGAELATPALRLTASYNPTRTENEDIAILGVVPDEFADIAYWRSDFGAASLESLLEKVDDPAARTRPEGALIPAGTRYLGVWVRSSLAQNQGLFSFRVYDAEGAAWEFPMGSDVQPTRDGWRFLIADLNRPSTSRPGVSGQRPTAYPLRLDAVAVRLFGFPPIPERATVIVDEVQTWDRDLPQDWRTNGFGRERVIESFEDLGKYELITGASLTADQGALSRGSDDVRGGEYAAVLTFTRQRGGVPVTGVRLKGPEAKLPVVVNRKFLEETGRKVGDEIQVYVNAQYVTLRIAGSFNLFPGYDPESKVHLGITDLAAFQAWADRVPTVAQGAFVNEAWLAGLPAEPVTRERLTEAGYNLDLVFDRDLLRAEAAKDPLVAASWEGILFLSFVAVLLLTAIGFIVSSHLAAQTRALEFAILRTMGFTGRQILGLVSLEQVFVVAAGLIVGTIVGLPLVEQMIGYLGVTETGREVLPPLISEVDWRAVLLADSLLLLVFIVTNASLAWTYSRLAVGRTLRIGEI